MSQNSTTPNNTNFRQNSTTPVENRKPVVKNTTFTLKKLFDINNQKRIHKPACNRAMNWGLKPHPTYPERANVRDYILNVFSMLDFGTQLVFWQKDDVEDFEILDANHRFNAGLMAFNEPFLIFEDYYGDIITFVKESNFNENLKKFMLEKIKKISLFDINGNKRIKTLFFHNNTEMLELWKYASRGTTEDFEEFWEELQKKFKFGHESLSASDIEVATKIYKYFDEKTMTQQCLKFNSKSTPWTELQIISAALSNFKIECNNIPHIVECKELIKNYYLNRNSNLEKYTDHFKVDDDYIFNAFDFLYALMEYWANEYNLWTKMNFDKSNNIDIAKMPWVFNVFRIIICNNDPDWCDKKFFTTQNIKLFITKCERAFKYWSNINKQMFLPLNNDEINEKVLGTTSKQILGKGAVDKIDGVRLMDWHSTKVKYMMCLLTGDDYKDTEYQNQLLRRGLFFNILAKARSFSKDSLTKAKKFNKEEIDNITTKKSGVWKEMDIFDSGSTHNRGNLNNTLYRIHTKSNEFLQSGISRDTFLDLLKINNLVTVRLKEVTVNNKKCKQRKTMEIVDIILLMDYYMHHVDIASLKSLQYKGAILHNDHLIVHSARCKTTIKLTKDRLGNFSPLMDKVNFARGNGSVKYFKDKLREIGDYDTLKIIDNMDLYPSDVLYDSFVDEETHSGNRVVFLKADKIEEINKFFESNEEKIWKSFLDNLYKFDAEN